MRLVLFVFIALGLAATAEYGLAESLEPSPDYLVGAVSTQTHETPRAAQDRLSQALNRAVGTRQHQAVFARALVTGILDPATTPDARQFLCREFSGVGTAKQAENLGILLRTPDGFADGCLAIESIPSRDLDRLFEDSLPGTKGRHAIALLAALGHRASPQSIPVVATRLGDVDPEVNRAAALALGHIGTENAAAILIQAHRDGVSDVVPSLVMITNRAITGGRDKQVASLLEALSTVSSPERAAVFLARLRAYPNVAPALLTDTLQGEDALLRMVAADQVRSLQTVEALQHITDALETYPGDTQIQVLEALRACPPKLAGAAATSLAVSHTGDVRRAAIQLLGDVGRADAVEFLATTAAQDGAYAKTARESLNRLSDPAADQQMLVMAQAEAIDPAVQRTLLKAIGTRQSTGAVPVLLALLDRADTTTREEALRSLADCAATPDLPAILTACAELHEDTLRRAAVAILVKTVRKDPDASLVNLSGEELPEAARTLVLAAAAALGDNAMLPQVGEAVGQPHTMLRVAGAEALASWPSPAAIPLLEIALEQGIPEQQTQMLRALVRLTRADRDAPPAIKLQRYTRAAEQGGVDDKRLALAGISELYILEAFQAAQQLGSVEELRAEAQTAQVHIAEKVGKDFANVAAPALAVIAAEGATEHLRQQAAALHAQLAPPPPPPEEESP